MAKHSIADVASRVPVMADYIHMDQKGIDELAVNKRDPDKAKDILVRYASEEWIAGILGAYDSVIIALAEEVLGRNKPMEEQMTLKQIWIRRAKVTFREPKKKVAVKGYDGVKGYSKSKPKHYENKVKTRLFIKSRATMNNKDLTKAYNDYALDHDLNIRSISAITTLKSRINTGKW